MRKQRLRRLLPEKLHDLHICYILVFNEEVNTVFVEDVRAAEATNVKLFLNRHRKRSLPKGAVAIHKAQRWREGHI